jgi:uncharacterized protein (TIGR03067 family)
MRALLTLATALALTATVHAEPKDDEKVQGEWTVTAAEKGKKPIGDLANASLTIKGDQITLDNGDKKETVTFVLDPAKAPKHITITDRGEKKIGGIYKLEGDTLTICFIHDSDERPTSFETKEGTALTLLVLKRKK